MGRRLHGNKIGAPDFRNASPCSPVSTTACDSAIQHRPRTLGLRCESRIEQRAGTVHNSKLSRRRVRACVYRSEQPDGTRCRRIPREKRMKRTAQELADYVGAQLRGDGLVVLESVASLKNAGPNDLSYAEEKFRDEVGKSRAGCVIAQSGEWPSKTVVIARNPKIAFARAAAWLLRESADDVGIHPSATVAPDAKIGTGVKIGAGAVIESGAVIGNS